MKLKAPSFMAEKIAHLPERDSGIDKQIVRVSVRRISASGDDPSKLRRRQAVELVNQDNGLSTIAFVMGGRLSLGTIALDYDSRHSLGIKYEDEDCSVFVRPAARYRVLKHYVTHVDLGYRLSIQLGLVGAVLGGASIIKDLVSWFAG